MRIKWKIIELNILLELYENLNSGEMHKSHPEVIKCSKIIRNLEINKDYSDKSSVFRNPNGIALKLANFLYLDPNYAGKGMKGYSKLDKLVFEDYMNNQNELIELIQKFTSLTYKVGMKGSPMGEKNIFNKLSKDLNISYAGGGKKIDHSNCDVSRFKNTLPQISFGLGRFSSIPWITFTNYNQHTSKGVYPCLLFLLEQKKICLCYGVSETNSPIFQWENSIIDGLSLLGSSFVNVEKYKSSFLYKSYDLSIHSNEINFNEIYYDLSKVIDDFHKQFQSNDKFNTKLIDVEMDINKSLITQSNALTYPFKFKNWLAGSIGAVRKPLVENTGRPLGEEIVETHIHAKITDLVNNFIVDGGQKLCALVGGPGNGKTDLMEFAVDKILEHDSNRVIKRKEIENNFKENSRSVNFSVGKREIILVQDASQQNPNDNSRKDSINQDLDLLNQSKDCLMILCVNRGVLEEFSADNEIIQRINELNDINSFFDNSIKVWGDNYKKIQIYTWGMDYDSLVDDDQILSQILSKSQCLSNYNFHNDKLCPSKNGKEIIESNSMIKNLQSFLRGFEIINSKRFTFRDIFDFIGYLFFIDKSVHTNNIELINAYNINQSKLNLLRGQNSTLNQGETKKISNNMLSQLLDLYIQTPSFRMFNCIIYPKSIYINKLIEPYGNDLMLKEILRSLNISNIELSLPKCIELMSDLDPNNYSIEHLNDQKIIALIEKLRFNSDDIKFIDYTDYLNSIEIELLNHIYILRQIYCNDLDSDDYNKTQLNKISELRIIFTNLMILIIKRALLLSKGFFKDKDIVRKFIDDIENGVFKRKMQEIIIDRFGDVEIDLMSKIGELHKSDNKKIISSADSLKIGSSIQDSNKPKLDLIALKVDNKKFIYIPYKIYKSVLKKNMNILEGSLDFNFLMWLETFKSDIAGVPQTSNVHIKSINKKFSI